MCKFVALSAQKVLYPWWKSVPAFVLPEGASLNGLMGLTRSALLSNVCRLEAKRSEAREMPIVVEQAYRRTWDHLRVALLSNVIVCEPECLEATDSAGVFSLCPAAPPEA